MKDGALQILQPADWARPKGFSHGIAARGRLLFIAGQVGWDASGRFTSERLCEQVKVALQNIVTILKAAGSEPRHVVRLTWFVTSRDAYYAELAEIGANYREVMGRHFPAMSVVQVVALMEAAAKVEIEATAVIAEAD
jgi:enamine deaminase RidA (YjgF/YER057c/UK114 family)